MAGGWSKDGAVQDQIDDSVSEAVERAQARLPTGESAKLCDECGLDIPQGRRDALPGVRHCVTCQSDLDSHQASDDAFNRRGSKDSQLR